MTSSNHNARLALAAAIANAFPAAACADAPAVAVDPVVVTGSRVEHNTFDLPAAVDVVGAERIGADQAKVNASEALAAVPGVTVLNRQNYAQDLQISSRGFGARSAFGVRGMRLMADGIPASMPDGQGQAATFNLDRAERIEVLRGPMSAVYGNHAGGVIQLFTPDGKGSPTVEGSFSAGGYGTWKADISSQGEVGGVGYVIDASRFSSDGYRDHSAVTRDQAMVKLSFHPDASSRLTLTANDFRQPDAQDPLGLTWARATANPRSVEPVALQFDTRKSIDHTQGGAIYERRFGEDVLQFSAYLGQRSVIQYQSIPLSAQRFLRTTSATSNLRRHSGGVIDFDRDFSGVSARWTMRRDLGGGKLTTTVGIDRDDSSDDRRGYENFTTTSSAFSLVCGVGGTVCGVKGNLRRNETDKVSSTDPYVQAEWQGERWGFTAGVRHSVVRFEVDDRYVTTGNGNDSGRVSYRRTTPVLAAVFKATPTLNLYASAARGFETPTLNELFYSGPGGSFSFDLKPATSNHLEIGAKAFVGEDTRLDVALFDVRTRDELVVASSTGGRTSYRNAGKTLRQGIELALDSRWQGGFTTRVAYTGLRATYEEGFAASGGTVAAGNRLPGVPRSSLFGEVAWRHSPSGFHTALEVLGRDKVYVEDTNAQKAAPGFAIANLRFGLEGRQGPWNLKGFVRLDNLFDKQYIGSVVVGDTNGRYYEPAPGRNLLVGASARYSF
jgi:iron complex outermembrane recepter protein